MTLIVNYLSNSLPLNGRTPAEISDTLPSYFTPANYAFAVWGLIYTGLIAFTVYQALPAQRQNPHIQRVGYLFATTSLLNAAWIFSWHYGQFFFSILVMAALLATLIAIYVRLDVGKRWPNLRVADRLLVHVPFSFYLAWISVATVANIASVVNSWGWSGLGVAGPVWAATMMLVAAVITSTLLFSRIDFPYAGIIIWALLAIRAKQMDVAIVANTAVLAAFIVLVFAFIGWYRTRYTSPGNLRPLTV